METKYLTMIEAAQYMHISKSYLYQLAAEKRIRHLKIGAKRLFTVQDIDEFLDSCKVEPEEPVRINYLNYNYSKSEADMVRNTVLRAAKKEGAA